MPRGRAANGSGLQPRKRADGRWECRFQVGINPSTGKTKYKCIYGKTAQECVQKLRAATAAVDAGTYHEPQRMTLRDWLDIWFTLESGCSLPDSFWSGGTLVKEKFVLNGVESAKVETVSRSGYGFYIRFKLPQLGNEPIGAVRVTLDGYQAGKQAQNVVVTVSENISPFRYTPQEHYQNQHYYFYTPSSEGYDDVVGASTTLRAPATCSS